MPGLEGNSGSGGAPSQVHGCAEFSPEHESSGAELHRLLNHRSVRPQDKGKMLVPVSLAPAGEHCKLGRQSLIKAVLQAL